MLEQPFAIPALLIFFAAVPLAAGIIPRNRFYGVRTRRTLSEDRVWYPVNRATGIALMISSCVYGAVAAVRPYHPQTSGDPAVWGIHLAAFAVPLIISIVVATRYAK